MEPWTLQNGVPSGEIGTFPAYSSLSVRRAIAEEVVRNICAVYGDNAIGESTPRKWFSRFKEDHFDINDTPRSGRSSEFDEDCLRGGAMGGISVILVKNHFLILLNTFKLHTLIYNSLKFQTSITVVQSFIRPHVNFCAI